MKNNVIQTTGEIGHIESCVEGQTFKIINIEIEDNKAKTRIMEMGFTPGTNFTIINFAPLGDPIAVRIRGYKVAISKTYLNQIVVESLDNENISSI